MQNRIHPTIRRLLIYIVNHHFAKEIKFYTHPKLRNTPQNPGTKGPESWTNILAAEQMISKATLPENADRFDELERTLAALYNILLLEINADEAYEYYRLAQETLVKGVYTGTYVADTLTKENFLKIHQLRNGIINNNEEDLTLLMYFIIYSDFGKSPMIREALEPFKDKVNIKLPPDDLIAAVLTSLSNAEIETVLPSFGKLKAANKERLKLFYPLMKPCFGHIMFYERGEKTFALIAAELINIPQVDQMTAIRLLFLAQFGDGIGAQGQARIDGSLNCTNGFYRTYNLMHDALVKLAEDLNSEQKEVRDAAVTNSFMATVKQRSSWLGFADDWNSLSAGEQRKRHVLLRVASMIRCPLGSAELLTDYYDNTLTQEQRQVLADQLSFDPQTGLESWTRVDYVATAPLNLSQDNMRAGNTVAAIGDGMRASVCVAMLLKQIATTYPDIIKDGGRSISLAGFVFDTPAKAFDPATFDARGYKFEYDTNRVEKIMHTPLVANSLLAAPAQPQQITPSVVVSAAPTPTITSPR